MLSNLNPFFKAWLSLFLRSLCAHFEGTHRHGEWAPISSMDYKPDFSRSVFFSASCSPIGGHRIPTTFPFVSDSDLVYLGFLIGHTICYIMAIPYAHNRNSFEKMPQKEVFSLFWSEGPTQKARGQVSMGSGTNKDFG